MQFAISMWISKFSSCKGSTICWYLNFVKFFHSLYLFETVKMLNELAIYMQVIMFMRAEGMDHH